MRSVPVVVWYQYLLHRLNLCDFPFVLLSFLEFRSCALLRYVINFSQLRKDECSGFLLWDGSIQWSEVVFGLEIPGISKIPEFSEKIPSRGLFDKSQNPRDRELVLGSPRSRTFVLQFHDFFIPGKTHLVCDGISPIPTGTLISLSFCKPAWSKVISILFLVEWFELKENMVRKSSYVRRNTVGSSLQRPG